MANGAQLRVRLLGGLAVEGRTEHQLGSRKGRSLLKVLALARGEPVSVDRLVDRLWTADVPARPADQLGVLVARLRGVLGAARVVRDDGGYRLVVDWLDLDELEGRVEEAAAAVAGGRVGAARAAALAAVAVARRGLLPGDDADWLRADRARVDTLIARAHHLAAAAASAAADHAAAAASAEAALVHDPYDEAALRLLMRAHGAAGRPASALAAYVRVRDRLVEELGIGPTAETEALHDELVLGGGPSAPPALPGPLHRGHPGLVGRAAPLARLDAMLGAVAEGRPAVAALALVQGEVGIGKTALVAAWADGLVAGRAVVLRGRCDELGRDLPLQPVADAVSLHLRAMGPDEADRLLGVEAAVLADLLGWSSATVSAVGVADTGAGQARLFSSLLAVVMRIGASVPVVVVVEDLHLSGPSTLAWLAFAQRRGRGIVVVATTRPGGPTLADAEVITLPPLSRDEAAELVGPEAAGRVDQLHTRSQGNPLFLLALAAEEGDDDCVVDGSIDGFDRGTRAVSGAGGLPRAVRDAVRAQLVPLAGAATTVQSAAVLGQQVDLDLLADVLRRPAVDVLADLEAAARVGLLGEGEGGLAFRHELVRAALDETAGSARRALVHRSAARALAGRVGADPLATAVHARLGGDTTLAVASFARAGGDALARFDADAALVHLGAAMALGGSAAVLITRARAHMATLDFDRAAADAARAVALDGGAAAFEISAWVAYYQRRHDEARAFADEGVSLAGSDVALRTSCLAVAGRVRHGAGDLDGAAERLGSARGAPAAVQGVADVWLAQVRIHRGEPRQALAALERPLVDPDHLAHPWAGLHGRFARAMALGHVGRLAEALAVCDDLDAAIGRTGAVGARFRGPTGNVRGWLLRHAGSPERGDEANEEVRELTSGPGGGPGSDALAEAHYVARLDLADGRLLVGDLDGANRLLGELAELDTWSGTMAWHQRQRLGLLRGRTALAGGDDAGAAQLISNVVADAAARGTRRYELLGRAWLALATGDGGPDRTGAVVDGLAGCAALEAWRLTAALAERFGVEAWRKESRRAAVALLAAAGEHRQALRTSVAAVLD